MPGHVAIESPAAARRQLLMENVTLSTTIEHRTNAKAGESNGRSSHRSSRVGETAGECAAVCCCCPCVMMHLVILAVYRLPTGLWRKKKRERLLRKKRKNRKLSSEEKEIHWETSPIGLFDDEKDAEEEEEESTDGGDPRGENDVVEWDKEMWGRFYGGGFWRSASQRTHDE